MALIAFAAPILPGKRAQWDDFIAEIQRSRRADFIASRQRFGVRERTFLQETPAGDIVIVTLEGDDPLAAFGAIANSDDDFTRWFVQQVQEIHGFDLRQPPEHPPHIIVDTGATADGEALVDGLKEHPEMWAQLIKVRAKPGTDDEVRRLSDLLRASEQPGTGLLRSLALRDQNDPSALSMLVIFQSEAAARAREGDARRADGLSEVRTLMAEIFEGPPEFTDFNVINDLQVVSAGEGERNKAILRRVFDDCFIGGNLGLVEGLFSPDWVNIDPSLPDLRGHEGARQLVTIWRTAFPDMQLTIDDMIADGDRVAARFTFSGTHTGDFQGLPPTGRPVRGTGTGIFRFAGGKDVEHHVNFDALGVMQQLGVIPVPEGNLV